MKGAKTVDAYIDGVAQYGEELAKLRDVLLSCGLEETVKWGAPCYVHNGKNVVGMAAFKSYFGLWFHQGALLADADGVLVNAGEGKTKALRQWRMSSRKDIRVRAIKAYVKESIGHVESGNEIKPSRGAEGSKAVAIPDELDALLKKDAKARKAFAALTPGKRREYCEHVAGAKREATRVSRAEKALPLIAAGVGLHDKYRNC